MENYSCVEIAYDKICLDGGGVGEKAAAAVEEAAVEKAAKGEWRRGQLRDLGVEKAAAVEGFGSGEGGGGRGI